MEICIILKAVSNVYLWKKKSVNKGEKRQLNAWRAVTWATKWTHNCPCEAKGLPHALQSPKGVSLERIKGFFLKKIKIHLSWDWLLRRALCWVSAQIMLCPTERLLQWITDWRPLWHPRFWMHLWEHRGSAFITGSSQTDNSKKCPAGPTEALDTSAPGQGTTRGLC